ncbi:MAG: hypothetical protein O7E51_03315 [Acidobacteria bacterium]|nr:hypothetical protein [Acidobacteriota bacterium]
MELASEVSALKATWGKTSCPGGEYAIQLSYTWVKQALQGAGLVAWWRSGGSGENTASGDRNVAERG